MNKGSRDVIIGYYEAENLFRPIFDPPDFEEFKRKYQGKDPVLGSHLANDDDYISGEGEKL